MPPGDLELPDNTVAGMLRIERSATPRELAERVGQLARRLQSPDNRELRRALTVWMMRLVLPRIAPHNAWQHMAQLDDLPEVHHMISERIDTWKEEWKQQGLQEGRQEGRQEGLQEGLLQGQAEALLHLLARRFGPVPEQASSRVRAADLAQLARWFDRAVDAPGLEQVFTEH